MSCSPARRAALALALSCSAAVYAQGQGLRPQSSSEQRSKTRGLPIILDADRIERAKTLLAEPASSVTDIALEVGFSETSSFSAAFRHTTGTTPTEYRRTLA